MSDIFGVGGIVSGVISGANTILNLLKDIGIKLIDKKTGKVISKKTISNVLTGLGSIDLLLAIRGEATYPAWNRLNIYDTAKNFIKSVTGTLSTPTSGAGYYYIQLVAQDSSNDTYTARYFGLHYNEVTSYIQNNFCGDYGQAITKPSDQILKGTWEIRIAFGTPP